jgi:hypothetical protein
LCTLPDLSFDVHAMRDAGVTFQLFNQSVADNHL